MRIPPVPREAIAGITGEPEFVDFLRRELAWPIPVSPLTFHFSLLSRLPFFFSSALGTHHSVLFFISIQFCLQTIKNINKLVSFKSIGINGC